MASERYVVVGKERKSDPFELYYIVPDRESGWRTAQSIIDQQIILGKKGHICAVISEDNWFEKKKMIIVQPPAGFDFTIPVGVWSPDKRLSAPAPTISKVKPFVKSHLFDTVKKTPEATEPELASTPEPTPAAKPASGFVPKKCPYCANEIPSNGAAQYSHLKKHVNELVVRKVLTLEQGNEIRKTKLTPEMEKVFSEAFSVATAQAVS